MTNNNNNKKLRLIPVLVTSIFLLGGCGGSSSKSSDDAAAPGGTSSGGTLTPGGGATVGEGIGNKKYHYITQIAENEVAEPTGLALRTDIANQDSVLKITSTGFPNFISKVTTNEGLEITDETEILKLFDLFINAKTGEVLIKLNQTLDFEQDSAFYSLDVRLGQETKNILVELFDVQKGTAAEPLTISSYDELKSFATGKFVSENIGNDLISGLPNGGQNITGIGEGSKGTAEREGLYVRLSSDIDASESASNSWQAFEHIGTFDGAGHVIDQLTTDQGFIANSNRFQTSNIKNLGFTNLKTSSSIINIQQGSIINSFAEGIYKASNLRSGVSLYFKPFTAPACTIEKVYSNIFYDFTGQEIVNTPPRRIEIGGLLGTGGSYIILKSGYSNGSINLTAKSSTPVKLGGLSATSLQPIGARSIAYSAMQLNINSVDGDINTPHSVGGLTFSSQERGFPENIRPASLASNASDYDWKFISNRAQNPKPIINGNGYQSLPDGTNQQQIGPDILAPVLTESQLMQAANFTGEWLRGDFDIEDGEYPVLKNMPYPHVEGASWMSAQDPGVAYQRATYNDYLTAP